MREVREVLEEALQIEQEGEAFYREAARTCGNPVTEKTFLYLADQEARHAEYFKLAYQALAEQKQWPTGESLEAMEIPAAAEAIFAEARAALEPGAEYCTDLVSTYEQAMDKERKSIALYKQQAAETEDADQREFFEFLVEQEKGHLELLANTQKYLDNPAQWFFDEEHWIVEG